MGDTVAIEEIDTVQVGSCPETLAELHSSLNLAKPIPETTGALYNQPTTPAAEHKTVAASAAWDTALPHEVVPNQQAPPSTPRLEQTAPSSSISANCKRHQPGAQTSCSLSPSAGEARKDPVYLKPRRAQALG